MKALAQEEELLANKLRNYEQEVTLQISLLQPHKTLDWFLKHVLGTNLPGVPRINQLQTALKILQKQEERVRQLFGEQGVVQQLLEKGRDIYDFAFIVEQHLKIASLKELSARTLGKVEKRFVEVLDRMLDADSVLYIQSLNLYISMYQAFPKQTPPSFVNAGFQRVRVQCAKVYEFVVKPLFEKRSLKPIYGKLVGLVSWLVIFQSGRLQLVADLSRKLNSFLLYHKDENSIEMIAACNALFDLLSVRFPRDSSLSHLPLASLLIKLTSYLPLFFQIWLQAREQFLNTLDLQHLLRTIGSMGAGSVVLDLLQTIWSWLLRKKKYNILLNLFSDYVRQDFLKLTLRSSDDVGKFFKLIRLFMIGFSNRERFEGEEMDMLTIKVGELVLTRNLSINLAYRSIIQIYSIYENRFSCLSQLSKKFFNEVQELAHFRLDVASIHQLYNEMVIRDAGVDDDSEWQTQRKTSNRYRGLGNLGNTCYMNAFLQALYMTKKLRAFVHSAAQDGQLPVTKTKIYALQFLFDELTRKQCEQMEPLRPDYFRSELTEPYRTSPVQQDAAEFGRVFLQQLTNEMQGSNRERLQKLLLQRMTKTIRCLTCAAQKKKEEGVFDLIVNIEREEATICISRLLQYYFRPQTFTGENRIQCDHCNRRNDAISELTPLRLSDILVLTISIFEYCGQGRKVLLPFTFEFVLNVGVLLQQPDLGEYQLYAFIVHIGSAVNSGHYICYARNLEENPMIWYSFDDGYVVESEIGRPQDFNFGDLQSPYMLFFSKKQPPVPRALPRP